LEVYRCIKLKTKTLTDEYPVQTDNAVGPSNQRDPTTDTQKRTHRTEDELAGLTAEDLSDVLKWSQVIAADINLTSCTRYALSGPALLIPYSAPTSHGDCDRFVVAFLPAHLNPIFLPENFNAQDAVLAMKTDEGEYTVATSYTPPQPCIVFEYVSIN